MHTYPLTAIDLFCGAGGLSLGLARAGFHVLCAVDNYAPALATYATNLGDHTRSLDLAAGTTDFPPATVIVGGPPCQGFSSAGMRRSGDVRNSLVRCFAQIVIHLRPCAFIFENVEGFLTAEGGNRVFDLLEPLISAGYCIHLRKINAANYGVPQHRKRVIALGGLGWEPTFPPPTHTAYGAPGADLASRCLPRTPTIPPFNTIVDTILRYDCITFICQLCLKGRSCHLLPRSSSASSPLSCSPSCWWFAACFPALGTRSVAWIALQWNRR